jgi:palmitoyl-protein thioesterase
MLPTCLQALLLSATATLATAHALHALPVIIWHGLGDSNANEGLTSLGDAITAKYDVPVFYIQVADDPKLDQYALRTLRQPSWLAWPRRASFFGRAWDEVALAAEQIAAIPEMKEGYDAIGLSQGGVFLRALAATTPDPPMRNLITLGSPHMGQLCLTKFDLF